MFVIYLIVLNVLCPFCRPEDGNSENNLETVSTAELAEEGRNQETVSCAEQAQEENRERVNHNRGAMSSS